MIKEDNIYIIFIALSRESQRLFMPNGNIYIHSFHNIHNYIYLYSYIYSHILISHQYINQYSNIYTYPNSYHLFITISYSFHPSLLFNILSLILLHLFTSQSFYLSLYSPINFKQFIPYLYQYISIILNLLSFHHLYSFTNIPNFINFKTYLSFIH